MDYIDRQTRSNRIFSIIKNFHEMFFDEFSKCGIKSCGHCGGTGLENKHSLNLCYNCGGVGYVGFEKINGEFICRSCNSYGCSICEGTGIVDWITHANGRDKPKYKKPRGYKG